MKRKTIELTDAEVRILRSALKLRIYLLQAAVDENLFTDAQRKKDAVRLVKTELLLNRLIESK